MVTAYTDVPQNMPRRAALGGLGGKGPLPHFCSRHGKDQISDDVPQNLAVNVRRDVALFQIGPEA